MNLSITTDHNNTAITDVMKKEIIADLIDDGEDTSTDLTVSSSGDSSSDITGEEDSPNNNSGNDREERMTRVGFSSIQIRSFNRIAGDHPDVRNGGPPLGIGWEYVQQDVMDLDDYEQQKEDLKANSDTPWLLGLRRLTSSKRRDILRQHFYIPEAEIEAAEAEALRIKKQRAKTNSQKKLSERTEIFMQSAKRKLQRTLLGDNELLLLAAARKNGNGNGSGRSVATSLSPPKSRPQAQRKQQRSLSPTRPPTTTPVRPPTALTRSAASPESQREKPTLSKAHSTPIYVPTTTVLPPPPPPMPMRRPVVMEISV